MKGVFEGRYCLKPWGALPVKARGNGNRARTLLLRAALESQSEREKDTKSNSGIIKPSWGTEITVKIKRCAGKGSDSQKGNRE